MLCQSSFCGCQMFLRVSEFKRVMHQQYIHVQKYRNLMTNFILNSQALVTDIFTLEEG